MESGIEMKIVLKDNLGLIVIGAIFVLLPFVLPYTALATEVVIFSMAVIQGLYS